MLVEYKFPLLQISVTGGIFDKNYFLENIPNKEDS